MELLMREAGVEDLDGLDRVMLVISDNSADRNKMAELVEKLSRSEERRVGKECQRTGKQAFFAEVCWALFSKISVIPAAQFCW